MTVAGPRPRTTSGLPLAAVAQAVGVASSADVEVTGVGLDSRTVQPGDLYAALPGANTHGARFAAAVAERGAVAVLTDPAGAELMRASGVDLPALVVCDPRAVLGAVAALVYANAGPGGAADIGLTLIGVTGTNGKTTTAYLLEGALRALGTRTGLIGTVEIRVDDQRITSSRTTPEAPDLHALIATMRERGVGTCVMEVSSHALALHRVDGLVYDLALFTNLSQDHLDMHGSMEEYFAAKASLFTPGRARAGVVCVDDSWGRRLARESGIPVVTLGQADGADIRLSVNFDGTFTLQGSVAAPGRSGERITVDLTSKSALPGSFNAVNTALATVTLLLLGYAADDVERALVTDPHVPGRMEEVSVRDPDGLPRGIVDYAHTPDAVSVALAALRPEASGGLIVVLGAGGDRDRGKRAAMGRAAAEGADVVVVTDDNPRSEDPTLIRAALMAGAQAANTTARLLDIGDRRTAIRAAVDEAIARGPGVIVAVVGKGHEVGQERAGVVEPFDDRVELRAALDAAGRSGR